jgi:tRNA-Thr(GGU) m(6)t(6)A37 methyltransferase TsaA
MSEQTEKAVAYEVYPVGYVRRNGERVHLEILQPYVPALKELDGFGHVQVFFWFSQFDDAHYRAITHCEPPYEAPMLGMFACRSPVRPNPIGLTTAKLLGIDHDVGVVEIENIDAFDGTPVLDLKPYIPICDRVQSVQVPEWASEWPEWMPEDGLDLEESEKS